jgi:hypothetical protein
VDRYIGEHQNQPWFAKFEKDNVYIRYQIENKNVNRYNVQ